MIQHVYEKVIGASLVKSVFVATDSKQICEAVEGFGGNVIMTSDLLSSGTDRIAEAVSKLQGPAQGADIIVNVQGDEPMVRPGMVDDVIRLMDDEGASIGTLAKRIEDTAEIADPNIVKVVFNAEGFALYFSRSPIPYHRDLFGSEKQEPGLPHSQASGLLMFKHIGIYAYRKDVLLKFSKLSSTKLENIEKLEQLRALENGFRIKVRETIYDTIGVDTPLDLERVKKCLSLSL